jgi:hypothetical protein
MGTGFWKLDFSLETKIYLLKPDLTKKFLAKARKIQKHETGKFRSFFISCVGGLKNHFEEAPKNHLRNSI